MILKKIIDGVFQVEFDDFDINQLDNAEKMEKPLVEATISFLTAQLGFKLSEVSIWNDFPIGGDINKPPFNWHHDYGKECDTLLLIYFVDEELTEETGGRIGFCDLDEKNKQYHNIVSGLCFIVNQHKTLHSLEIMKKQLTKRLCISCSLNGWDNFINANKIN
jgi:hypothetical protein